ncbi:MAG: hypothetical protein MUO41_14430 [Methyloceanibacter sp.]|nr:hypothetical protein [Methyloceanibacter sp.]
MTDSAWAAAGGFAPDQTFWCAIASGQKSTLGNGLRRLGLALIIGSLGAFLLGLSIALNAILIV